MLSGKDIAIAVKKICKAVNIIFLLLATICRSDHDYIVRAI